MNHFLYSLLQTQLTYCRTQLWVFAISGVSWSENTSCFCKILMRRILCELEIFYYLNLHITYLLKYAAFASRGVLCTCWCCLFLIVTSVSYNSLWQVATKDLLIRRLLQYYEKDAEPPVTPDQNTTVNFGLTLLRITPSGDRSEITVQSWAFMASIQCWNCPKWTGGGVRCRNVWHFAQGLKFKADFSGL